MNKENVWKVIKCGGKIVFLTVTVTGKILKELILETKLRHHQRHLNWLDWTGVLFRERYVHLMDFL